MVRKKFNFDISKFEKFKHKIIYLKIDHEPKNLIYKSQIMKILKKIQGRKNKCNQKDCLSKKFSKRRNS